MAWVTSDLCHQLETTDLLLPGKCMVGDNAYVKKGYMAVPLKGLVERYDDAYNFYVSQLRITIERAFGVLVHRWAILRRPLHCPLAKVAPLVMTLCRLHNYCIDMRERDALRTSDADAMFAINYMTALQNLPVDIIGGNADLVRLERGRPRQLLHGGSHFQDDPHNRNQTTSHCPMDDMYKSVESQQLKRPPPKV